jgi:hypothetical protein
VHQSRCGPFAKAASQNQQPINRPIKIQEAKYNTMKLSSAASSLLILTSATSAVAAASFTNPSSNYNRCLTAQESSFIAEALSNNESSSIDLFPDKSSNDQSSYWSIEYRGIYKLLRNKEVNTTYIFYQCGLDNVPSLLDSIYNEQEEVHGAFPVPFQGGLIVTETTQIPNIEILNKRHLIVAFAVNENLISSPCLSQQVIPDGKDDGTIEFLPLYNDTELESYIKSYQNGDVLAFGGAWDENIQMENKIVISSVGESAVLAEEKGRDVNQAIFEWLEVYGALFNEEKLASRVVEETKARYDCHTANAAAVAEERRKLEENARPVVLWAYHMQDYNGDDIGWDVGECPNYYCTYAEHCQVELLNSTEGSVDYWGYAYMSDEEFLEFGKDADVWIYPSSNWNTLVSQKAEYLSQFKSVENMEVYDYQKSGESAWFEQRLAEYGRSCVLILQLTHVSSHLSFLLHFLALSRHGSTRFL